MKRSATRLARGNFCSTSNTVNIDVTSVPQDTTVTITASYDGVTKTASITVTPPALEPRFNVVSRTRGNDACAIDESDGHIDCDFDASPSNGAISTYFWTLTIGGDSEGYRKETEDEVTFMSPNCSYWENGGALDADESFEVKVGLRVRGKDGKESSTVTRTIKVYPQKHCGYT